MMKVTQEHTICKNIVNLVFKAGIPYNVLLTDITYLFYGDSKKYYLSTIKDTEMNEILAYYIVKI
jgi:transposase InsO family protein